MKDSYKKRLYTNVISLSAVVLVAVLTQGTAAADTQDSTETQPIANKTETVVPAEKSTKTNTTEATATPDSSHNKQSRRSTKIRKRSFNRQFGFYYKRIRNRDSCKTRNTSS